MKRNLVDSKHFYFFKKSVSTLDWKSINIDYVIESTGKIQHEQLNTHIVAGAKKVILSVPSELDSIKKQSS
jgi:glyceraldehyde 3-phosphate dehydrogenase